MNQLVEDFDVGKYFDWSQSSEEETAKNDIADELSYTLYIVRETSVQNYESV